MPTTRVVRSGRSEFCRERGFRYADLEALGYKLVVIDVRCRYRSSSRYDETVIVRTGLKEQISD